MYLESLCTLCTNVYFPNQENVFFVVNKIQIQQLKDFSFLFFAGVVEVEVKLVDGGFF
jgi:hypothetical protein